MTPEPSPLHTTHLAPIKDPPLSEEEIAIANLRHDRIYGCPGNMSVPKNYWVPSPPTLDKRASTVECDKVVWAWHGVLEERKTSEVFQIVR